MNDRLVGRDTLIAVQGTGFEGPDNVWDRVLDWMETAAQCSQEGYCQHAMTDNFGWEAMTMVKANGDAHTLAAWRGLAGDSTVCVTFRTTCVPRGI